MIFRTLSAKLPRLSSLAKKSMPMTIKLLKTVMILLAMPPVSPLTASSIESKNALTRLAIRSMLSIRNFSPA